ncbi:hypothetical protein [Streptomyces sp. NPDC056682]|uniref:hypothetical protein n=1 Tax=Streptomyces sp. NPDC056682 TaxID=3345909 RepID=UPI0036CA4CC8
MGRTSFGIAGILAAEYSFTRRRTTAKEDPIDRAGRHWRMPPLETLTTPTMSTARKLGMGARRTYLFIAMKPVTVKIVQMALGR